jgi:hypothetical protein
MRYKSIPKLTVETEFMDLLAKISPAQELNDYIYYFITTRQELELKKLGKDQTEDLKRVESI